MPHIHTKPGQHDHTVSAYIVRTDLEEPKIMLHMHKKLHTYMQFGGHVELDETPWQTLCHEIREETGFDIDQLQILQPKQRITNLTSSTLHPVPLTYLTHKFGDIDHYHSDLAFGFVASEPPRHKPDETESQDIRLFTLSELETEKRTFDDVRTTSNYIFTECLPSWEAIPTSNFKK